LFSNLKQFVERSEKKIETILLSEDFKASPAKWNKFGKMESFFNRKTQFPKKQSLHFA
jgi:hypothetical protein